MKTRIFPILIAGLIGLSVAAMPAQAEEKAKDTEKKGEAKKGEAKKGEAKKEDVKKGETKKIKVSNAFMNRWKKIQKVTKQRAYETQQTRTVAGVRGAEAEDAILDQLYYKGGVRYPSRVDLKNAITQLQEAIKADPKAEAVPEQKYFVAQCHAQLGETDQAKAVYGDLVKNYGETEFGKLAREELGKMAK